MIYQITGTQSFLTAVYLFVKGKSEQNYMLVCHCTFNDVFSTPLQSCQLHQVHTRRIRSSSLSNLIPTATEKSLPKH